MSVFWLRKEFCGHQSKSKIMNSNQFTHKTEQIISNTQQIAYQNNNTNIEPAHLLKSIID